MFLLNAWAGENASWRVIVHPSWVRRYYSNACNLPLSIYVQRERYSFHPFYTCAHTLTEKMPQPTFCRRLMVCHSPRLRRQRVCSHKRWCGDDITTGSSSSFPSGLRLLWAFLRLFETFLTFWYCHQPLLLFHAFTDGTVSNGGFFEQSLAAKILWVPAAFQQIACGRHRLLRLG